MPPEAAQRPAGQRLAGIPLALAEVQQRPGREAVPQPLEQLAGELPLRVAQRGGVPLVAVHVVDRHEGRLAAHREAHVARREVRVDLVAQPLDRLPLLLGVGLRDARVLVDPLHRHVVGELGLAGVVVARLGVLGPGVRPGDRRGGERVGRAGQRDVALAGEQPRGRVEADPAGAGEVDLGPGVQVGEVVLRARRAVERGDVGLELDQVARDEPGRQAELPEELDQQPGRVAARAAAQRQRLLARLDARLQADQVADRLAGARRLSSTM